MIVLFPGARNLCLSDYAGARYADTAHRLTATASPSVAIKSSFERAAKPSGKAAVSAIAHDGRT
jgi:hypothetical protein